VCDAVRDSAAVEKRKQYSSRFDAAAQGPGPHDLVLVAGNDDDENLDEVTSALR
jgi:hypothetical protein